jgi:hypothetical protein
MRLARLVSTLGLALILRPATLALALVDTSNPVDRTPSTASGGTACYRDDRLLHGHTLEAPPSATGAASVHEGRFSDGINLAAPPNVDAPTNSKFVMWADNVTKSCYSAQNFSPVLRHALEYSRDKKLPEFSAGALEDLLSILSDLGAETSTSEPAEKFVQYKAQRGRWLDRKNLSFLDPGVFYSDPSVMDDLRERGARLYCSAREAQRHQGRSTLSMGKQSAFSVTLFGQDIDFLSMEPTFAINGPLPFIDPDYPGCPVSALEPSDWCAPEPGDCETAAHDGAQAFVVPFQFGTQITPVSFLPSLDEIRYPVVMVSGDSEISRRLSTGRLGASKTYQVVTHADSVLSAEGTGEASTSFPLFYVGPVPIDFHMGLVFAVGQLYSDETIGGGSCDLSPPGANPPDNDRLLLPPLSPPGWPPSRIGGPSSWDCRSYNDGAWFFGANAASMSADSALPRAFTVLSDPPVSPAITGYVDAADPFLVRALEDDDRHVRYSTSVGINAGVSGDAEIGVFPLKVDLDIGGDLCGTVALRHALRDAALVQSTSCTPEPDSPHSISAISVTPSTRANAQLSLFANVKIEIDLGPLLTWTLFDENLIELLAGSGTITLADWQSGPWEEKHRARIGTGSPWGDSLKQPNVMSHLPNGRHFDSFPEDVDSCLSGVRAAEPNPVPPDLCGSRPAESTPPQTNVCMYAGSPHGRRGSMPPDVCSNLELFVATTPGTPEQQQCLLDRFTLLCKVVSQQQLFSVDGVVWDVVAHVLLGRDGIHPADAAAIRDVVEECVAANVPGGWDAPDDVKQEYISTLFDFAFCHDDGTLVAPEDVLTRPSDATVSPEVTRGSCSPVILTPR